MINFNFGNKKPDKKQLIVVSLVLSTIVATLSQCTGASQEILWDFLDEVQRSLFPGTVINDVLLKDPNIIKRRVERDVTRAIDQVTPEYDRIIEQSNKKYKPKYVEKAPDGSEAQKLLGGEMRICAIWVDDCPKD